jgi:RHS repeat-associated protein
MKRTIIACLMITFFQIVHLCPSVLASDITLLGPIKYQRTSGPPDRFLNTFTGIPGEARIQLQNGHSSGEKRIENSVSSALVSVNGQPVFSKDDFNTNIYMMEKTISILAENTVSVELDSAPGSYITISISQESMLPLVSLHIEPKIISPGQSAVLAWSSTQGDDAHIDHDIGIVPLNGALSVNPKHTTIYTFTVTGKGGTVSAQTKVQVHGNPEPLSEGSFGRPYQDLIPDDATIPEYDAARFSIVTGMVCRADGSPMENAMIRVFGHPEYGTAYTSVEGRFSIPVEGGKTFTLIYQKEGCLESQRKVYVPWNDIARVDTVRLVDEDTLSTHITFDGDPNTVVVHQSTEVEDEFGSRTCSLVFKGDNQAFFTDANANDIHELPIINVRATEYPTLDSMPAQLPANSAFTYCVELTVDGAENVRFSKPVVIWVDNFLGFDVGEVIPVGFYSRDKGVWEPDKNGVVVKLLDIDEDTIVDALDATGDDLPDDLNGDGSFLDEIQGIQEGQRYIPGATFWRTETYHFTPCDLNLPQGSPPDAVRPNPTGIAKADTQTDKAHSCRRYNASYTEDRSRIFHEDIPIPGTDLTLHYASDRVQGYHTRITVPASGDTVPASLKKIIVNVNIAGRVFSQELLPLPDRVTDFYWNSLDYNGRLAQTPISAHVAIGFVYNSLYYSPGNFDQAFGQPGVAATDVPGREDIVLWEQQDILISPPKSKGTVHIAEGWSLSSHHHMNLQDYASLYKGDGTLVNTNVRVINMIYFPGSDYAHYPDSVAADAAGNIYVADSFRGVIYKMDTGGNRTPFAGGFNWWGYSGDGGLATDAQLYKPNGLAVDDSGNVYVTDLYRIRKIDISGIITTIAGTGVQGYTGDDGPAAQAQLWSPKGIAVDREGCIYFAENDAHRIRKIDPNGIITTIAGTGSSGFSGDGGPAVNASLSNPYDVAVDGYGNLYIADSNNNRIRRVDPAGIITTIAGSGDGGFWGGSFSGDGGPAVNAKMRIPKDVDVDSAGNVYISDTANLRIRLVNRNGIITTIAGSGTYGWDSATHPAAQAAFKDTSGIAVDAGGNIFVADTDNHSIRKISHPSVFKHVIMSGGNVFSEGNGQGHIISSTGLHTNTIDLDSGLSFFTFNYDDDQRLACIADQFGNTTDISRDTYGTPIAIVSPEGITTHLTIDTNNHLTRIEYSDGSYFDFEYSPEGLLTAKTEPAGNRFEHMFDDHGRLINALDQTGGNWTYTKSANSKGDDLICITTAEGNTTSYLDHIDSTGAYTSTITDPTGGETIFQRSADSLSSSKSLPCGMDLFFAYDLDPEYLHPILKEVKETTPSGLTRLTTREKRYADTNGDEAADLVTETLSLNGKRTVIESNVLSAQKTYLSAEGRTVAAGYDPDTLLLTKLSIPGRYDTIYHYNSKGSVAAIGTHLRETSFTYNTAGLLESVSDGSNSSTFYAYDEAGRIIRIDRPDNSSIWFTYDRNGNMTILTNPSAVDHVFEYNAVNSLSNYRTLLSGNYSYEYDMDRRLTKVTFPSGKNISNIYDATQLMQIQLPEGNIDYTYLCGSKAESIAFGAEAIAFEYDGNLLSSEMLSGTLNQAIYYEYNNDFNITEVNYAGETEKYVYDGDGFLTGAGRFTVNRNSDNAQPQVVTDGTVSITNIFNGYGEVDQESTTVSDNGIYSWDLVRDNTGRIVQKTETISQETSVFQYAYDDMGRLLTVTKDDILTEAYQYDLNGSRSFEMNLSRNIDSRRFEYSAEDQLLKAGTVTYQYDPDGFLIRKSDGADSVTYEYSSRGELLSVMQPYGSVVEYLHDPLGRRIAKEVNGTLTEKYLWQDMTRLLAVYDGTDDLLMRFEYADSRVPVAMKKNGVTYYLIYDPVGSLRAVADSAGHMVKRIDYDAFGNVISDTNPSFNMPFSFAGGLYDKDTGLIRFGYRDYDPDMGRWTAKDPIFFNGRDVDLYGYCLNDPLNFVDPNGQFGITGIVIGGIAGAYGGFLSGITSGSITSRIIGGVSGAIVGSIVGSFMPQTSSVAGSIVGGAISGFFGGASGGIIKKAISSPCASVKDIAKSGVKGASIGALTGLIGGSVAGGAASVGATGPIVHISSAMIKAPIGWGMGIDW